MKLVLLGDVGAAESYHAGDEAMLEAALDEIRLRLGDGAVQATVVSAHPADTAARYGVDAIARIGFGDATSPRRLDKEARLAAVIDAARGHGSALDAADSAWRVIEAIADADAVLITGGGNLTSSFREHVYERAALAAIARLFGRRLIVTGQSLGPRLDPRDAALVAEILQTASLAGIREADSFADALALAGPDTLVAQTLDDASFLVGAAAGSADVSSLASGTYVVASFPPYGGSLDLDDYIAAVGGLVARAAELTGLPVVLVPHEAPLDAADRRVDVLMHDRILEAAGADVGRSLSGLTAREIAEVTRGAALSLSGRYHPAVFALAAGVPAIGIGVDDYTSRKIRGAFRNLGAEAFALPALALLGDDAHLVLEEVWTRRAEIRESLTAAAEVSRAAQAGWWDAVVSTIGGTFPDRVPELPAVEQIELADTALAVRLAALARYSAGVWAASTEARAANELLLEQSDALRDRERELAGQVDGLESAVREHEISASLLRQELAARSGAPIVGEGEDLLQEIDALRQQLFERERYIAFLGRRVHDLSERATQAASETGRAQDVAAIQDLEAKVADLTTSTSWRVTLPIRVLKNPKPYVRKFTQR